MIATDTMSPAELAALLHFHADTGVEWLLEPQPVDRFAEFAASRAQRSTSAVTDMQQTHVARQTHASTPPPARESARRAGPPAAPAAPANIVTPMAMPDGQAIEDARFAAQTARSLPELKAAMAAFSGCNLKNSARHLVFADGSITSGVMIIGPMPNGDDDRAGQPFSGKPGQMLDRMLAAIGLDRASVLMTHVIPWRPPGNRVPSPRETEICRPFIERQIALAGPRHILLLGNFTGRFFFGGTDTIHDLRGQWRRIAIEGTEFSAMATLHPQDLMTAPASKKLVWQDLLSLRSVLRG